MDVNPPKAVRLLLWPMDVVGPTIGKVLPRGNIGTPEHPVYEGTPLDFVAGFALAFFSILLYPVATCLALVLCSRIVRRRSTRIMFTKTLPIAIILLTGIVAPGQTKSYNSPTKTIRALIVPVCAKGYKSSESRVDIRASSGTLLRRKSFASRDHSHGEGVDHAEWTSDGRFFVFNTSRSGGHQPWHVATYAYSVAANRFYGLDSVAGPITSDFSLRGDTLVTTRLGTTGDEKVPVTIRLSRWR